MATIPELREMLKRLSTTLASAQAQVDEIERELHRRRNAPRAPQSSTPMTPRLRRNIRTYAAANPDLTQLEIAIHFGVNQGRVSEALHGKRT